MTMTERTIRASVVVFPAVGLVYFAVVLLRLRDADAATVSWVVPMVASWIAIIVVIVAAFRIRGLVKRRQDAGV